MFHHPLSSEDSSVKFDWKPITVVQLNQHCSLYVSMVKMRRILWVAVYALASGLRGATALCGPS